MKVCDLCPVFKLVQYCSLTFEASIAVIGIYATILNTFWRQTIV